MGKQTKKQKIKELDLFVDRLLLKLEKQKEQEEQYEYTYHCK
jgi:hypothetical protein